MPRYGASLLGGATAVAGWTLTRKPARAMAAALRRTSRGLRVEWRAPSRRMKALASYSVSSPIASPVRLPAAGAGTAVSGGAKR